MIDRFIGMLDLAFVLTVLATAAPDVVMLALR